MRTLRHIDIPNPCHQRWEAMTPVELGRQCSVCQRTVIDFTRMSDRQVIDILSTHKNACGRFEIPQLAGINNRLKINNLKKAAWWKQLSIAATVIWGIACIKIPAIAKAKTEHHPVRKNENAKSHAADSIKYVTITGKVLADDDGLPLPGATVRASDRAATTTNANGAFTLRIADTTRKISVSFIEFKDAEIN